MFSRRAILLCASLVAGAACATQAAVAATSAGFAPVRVSIVEAAGVSVGNMNLPSVSVAPVTPPTAGLGAASGVSAAAGAGVGTQGQVLGNTQLTIRGQVGDVVSTTVPESFTVVRSGGQETLTVRTNTNTEYNVGGGDVVLGDSILNSDTMSVDIGGALNLASAGDLVPGPYEGLLVVVVQYN